MATREEAQARWRGHSTSRRIRASLVVLQYLLQRTEPFHFACGEVQRGTNHAAGLHGVHAGYAVRCAGGEGKR